MTKEYHHEIEEGYLYRCPTCGSELSVVRRGSSKLDPHCCNHPMNPVGIINRVYQCLNCGSEVMVVKGGANLDLHCCNTPMEEKQRAA